MPGQAHDLSQAHALLDGQTARQVIADRGYDSNGFRIVAGGAKDVVPAESSRITNLRLTPKPTGFATASNVASTNSNTFGASRPGSTDETSIFSLRALQWLPA
jgi:hypothetical protein